MEKVLITGSTGFVGCNLTTYLSKIENVQTIPISRETLISGDTDISDCNIVIHLAGKAHDLKQMSSEQSYFDINYKLTKELYDKFLLSNATKFIFISSVKAVADTINYELDESVLPSPITPYGQSKLQAEEYISSQTLPSGKCFFILRPCMIHGPGNKGNLNLLYRMVQNGVPNLLGAFKNRRSFLSVENLCFVIKEMILRNDIPLGIYHVADEKALSTSEVINIINQELSRSSKQISINATLIRTIAAIGNYIPLPLNTERLKKLTENYVVNTNKLTSVLGKPLPVAVDEGLRVTIRSFQNNV